MVRITVAIIALAVLLVDPAAAEGERTLSVNGSGFVAVPPDMARVSVAVIERDKSLAAAQQAVAEVTARILKLSDGLDIDRQRVNSTGATVRPDYRWNRSTEEQELIGYVAERQIQIEVRDLDKLGKLIEGAVGAGANQVSPPVLDSSLRRDAYRDALANAAMDARKNAQALADTLGVTLGPVLQVNAGGNPPPIQPMMRGPVAMAAMDESAPATYNAGDIRFEASVSATFMLVDK